VELFDVFWGLAMLAGIVTIVLAVIAKRERAELKFEQAKHVKVLEPPYDWSKDPD
jgi:hypothetical protein